MGVGLLLMAAGLYEVMRFRSGQRELAESWEQFSEKPESRSERPSPRVSGALARLSIPRLGADLFVASGTGKGELRRGPGHLRGTAQPGAWGNSVIAGHRDTHFRVLKDIRVGDRMVVETADGQFSYSVERTFVVLPTERGVLRATQGPTLTLITCYPFYYVGPAPKRFIVQAKLVESDRTGLGSSRNRFRPVEGSNAVRTY